MRRRAHPPCCSAAPRRSARARRRLVAAEAADDIGRCAHCRAASSPQPERRVARRMAVVVVHLLHAVDVEIDDAGRRAVALGEGHHARQLAHEGAAVRDRHQRIFVGEPLEIVDALAPRRARGEAARPRRSAHRAPADVGASSGPDRPRRRRGDTAAPDDAASSHRPAFAGRPPAPASIRQRRGAVFQPGRTCEEPQTVAAGTPRTTAGRLSNPPYTPGGNGPPASSRC